jgi:hypothetical protein
VGRGVEEEEGVGVGGEVEGGREGEDVELWEDGRKVGEVLGGCRIVPVLIPRLCAQKIRSRFLATPDKSATLESLVENEKNEKKRVATEGLLWLIRYVPYLPAFEMDCVDDEIVVEDSSLRRLHSRGVRRTKLRNSLRVSRRATA